MLGDSRAAFESGSENLHNHSVSQVGESCGGGDGQDPCPEDAVYYAEVEDVKPFGAADAHDACGDGMCR